jgi:hypothetical protein
LTKQSSINFEGEKKPLSEDDILNKLQDEKFKGNCFRIDGKKITENQVKQMDKTAKEDTYDPRKNRLANGIVILYFNFLAI